MAAKRAPALDRIDVKILAVLQRDGRSTIQKLAHAVGLSPRAALERVRRLEASGVIAGYQAVVELGRLARPVNVFAEIVLEKQANLTSTLLDDDHLGVARIVSHVALRPIRRFTGYPEKLIGRNLARR
jgi:DNA-binding Lrp family transcriptional regulator